jgi:hypothetical protein
VLGLTVGSTGIAGDRSGWGGRRDALAPRVSAPRALGRRARASRLRLQEDAQRARLQHGLHFLGRIAVCSAAAEAFV